MVARIRRGCLYMASDWLQAFPLLKALDRHAAGRLRQSASLITLPTGATLFAHGSPCHNYLFVTFL